MTTTPDDSGPAAPDPAAVRMDPDLRRFVLDIDGTSAFIDYREVRAGELALTHAEVPRQFEGRGVGTALVQGTLALARQRHLQVLPYCPFVHAYIEKHPEDVELVSDKYPRRSDFGR